MPISRTQIQLAIYCATHQEYDLLMQALGKAGHHWSSGAFPTELDLYDKDNNTVLIPTHTMYGLLIGGHRPDAIPFVESEFFKEPDPPTEPEFIPPSTEDLMAIFDGE